MPGGNNFESVPSKHLDLSKGLALIFFLLTRQAHVLYIMGPNCDKLYSLLFVHLCMGSGAHICVGLLTAVIDLDTDCTNFEPLEVPTDICNVNFARGTR